MAVICSNIPTLFMLAAAATHFKPSPSVCDVSPFSCIFGVVSRVLYTLPFWKGQSSVCLHLWMCIYNTYSERERESERAKDRKREREKERKRKREREKERKREREKERKREREKERKREREKERKRERENERT